MEISKDEENGVASCKLLLYNRGGVPVEEGGYSESYLLSRTTLFGIE